MGSNSSQGKGTNNLHDPTLKEKEGAQGVSGEAIQGEKKVKTEPDRKSDVRSSS